MDTRQALLTLLLSVVVLLPPPASAADTECQRPAPAAPQRTTIGSKPAPAAVTPPLAVAVSCVDFGSLVAPAATTASGAAAGAAAAAPARTASSAEAADRSRALEHDTRRYLLQATGALALVLGLAAAVMAWRAVQQAGRGDGLRISSHWGGFGGAGGGWQLSPAVVSLLAAGVLALAAALVAASVLQVVQAVPGVPGEPAVPAAGKK